ncbi:MAG: glucoamylase family protein [Thermoguttaceae bacterium]
MNREELCRHARQLAAHRTGGGSSRAQLLDRLDANARVIQDGCQRLRSASPGAVVAESAAWLLDNHYLIQEQIRVARHDLPRRYSSGLPCLCEGPHQGLPRVYELALELVLHLDGHLSQESLHAFIDAYQERASLTLGELWAIPIMLRLAAIEMLRRTAERIGRRGPGDEDDPADLRAMRNGVGSLRVLGALDWKRFVETESAVEQVLRKDPAGIYGRMDFDSRDHYRHVVERLAQHCPLTEQQVAERALYRAQVAAVVERGKRGSATLREKTIRPHVGYTLLDRGLGNFERAIGYQPPWWQWPIRRATRAPLPCYLLSVLLVWLAAVSTAVACLPWKTLRGFGLFGCAALLGLLAGAASQFAVALVNWLFTLFVPPRPVMRLDFSDGIPAPARTLVAVPTLLTSRRVVRDLVRQLELRWLANRGPNLIFALVTDLPDSDRRSTPHEERLVRFAAREIERLNRRYRRRAGALFYLLHRPRSWNPQQGVWMGEERKRGKLAALNQLLLTGRSDAFSVTVGDLKGVVGVRYVITLDADTQLPPATACAMVGCMAHPLNWPEIDPATRIVTRGYAILQPRTGATISDSRRSLFSRLLAADAGIDPYTRQTSDVYHDLFGRGSFIGKGIYDVAAFERVLAGRFPANRILSHDLIEGCYAGSGLVSDIELFEHVPRGLLADAGRRHRWIRGDWQIGGWLRGRVPSANGATANPLDGLSRWKLFDNLRRSVSPLFLLGFLTAGLIAAPDLAIVWTLMAAVLVFGPAAVAALPGLLRRPDEMPRWLHVQNQGRGLLRALAADALGCCTLPFVAYSNADAIGRTLYRLCVSHRNLLEWTTASDAEAGAAETCGQHYRAMWPCVAASAAIAIAIPLFGGQASLWAAAVLLSWLFGPPLAWWVSRPPRIPAPLLDNQVRQLRRWARQTWHYFEETVGPEDHWLPPDNVQDSPRPMVAHRVSPTNIGMSLLADLAARDLGYLPTATLLERARHVFESLGRMRRYRGHFLNWYDTRTLEPAGARYVSSVDSGNLWGALMVFRAGLAELRERPLVNPQLLDGLRDTLDVIARLRRAGHSPFDACLARLQEQCSRRLGGGARRACGRLCRIRTLAASLASASAAEPEAVQRWTRALVRQSAGVHRDIARLAFWIRLPALFDNTEVADAPAVGRRLPFAVEAAGGVETSVDPSSGNGGLQVICHPATAIEADGRRLLATLHAQIVRLDRRCSLRQLAAAAQHIADQIAAIRPGHAATGGLLGLIARAAAQAASAAREELHRVAALRKECQRFSRMDFRFLYHPQRKLLAIGFDVDRRRRENSYYGLLASEARLTSFLALSHGQLPIEHWFALGRMIAVVDRRPVLLSWSGSMFEHLMPPLLMPAEDQTLLESSCRRAVRRQIAFGRRHAIPWGISESCHAQLNEDQAYHYRMFGVPGLGLMRGLDEYLVVAPYASALAAMVDAPQAVENLERLERSGCLGPMGFFDAIDYTAMRNGDASVPRCKTVMAHHSGMTLLAFTNVLLGWPMRRRFLATRRHEAFSVLLEERWPRSFRPIDPP